MDAVFYLKELSAKFRVKQLQVVLLVCGALFLTSCMDEDIEGSYYTFTGETVGAYIRGNSDYTEFARILDTTKVMGLLNAYGQYTCFLPTNEALRSHYLSLGKKSLTDFPLDSLRILAYNHLIKDFLVSTESFREGMLSNLSMNGRNISVAFSVDDMGRNRYLINGAPVQRGDVELHNGIVHILDGVISPTDNTVVDVIGSVPEFSLFSEALNATGLFALLLDIEDTSFEPPLELIEEHADKVAGQGDIKRVPRQRKYGFTALVPSDAVFAEHGISDLESMKSYAKQVYDSRYPAYADLEDITDPNHSLNRFIAYHLLDRSIPEYYFIEAYDNTGFEPGTSHSVNAYDMSEYLETMAPNSLMEVKVVRITNEYNVFNQLPGGKAVRLDRRFIDLDAVNGIVHGVDGLLVYSQEVVDMLTSKRIRMDAASFFRELRNNDMRVGKRFRSTDSINYARESFYFPPNYLDRLWTSEGTQFTYLAADDRFLDYQGDEIWLVGLYHFKIETPPIPAGTYEIRFGYQPTIFRGAAQMYWNGVPVGIPLDLRLNGNSGKVGYEVPGTDPTDPEGYDNDRMMRNRGYMKAPASFKVLNGTWYGGGALTSARNSEAALRKILGIFTFEEDGRHEFEVRAAREGEFMLDYLEFIPVELIEFEDID